MRVDLDWTGWQPRASWYRVLRSGSPRGPFECIRDRHGLTVCTDFLGEDGLERFYRIQACFAQGGDSSAARMGPASPVIRAASKAEDAETFLTGVQGASIRYFTTYAHPVSGLAREWGRVLPKPRVKRTCATGATGMGFMNLIVGLERGVLPPKKTRQQVLKMLRFLQDNADRFDGVFPHWLNGATGKTIVFGGIPGGDIVETAFLMQGMITVREYFSGHTAMDAEIRERADALWRDVRWDRFTDEKNRLYWHWPAERSKRPLRITGSNEGHLAYLLAVASPTHPAPDAVYRDGWVGTHRMVNSDYYGIRLDVGRPHGFPLFWAQYSYLGLDPRGLRDQRVPDYFTHFRDAALIHWRYAQDNPLGHKGYGPLRWGLTASMGPDGYGAWTPMRRDNGTIAPTAALSSMPYLPDRSLAMLVDLYERRGPDLWGEFGFYDAFNDTRGWVATGAWIGIDVAPIAPMIENHRTGLCWRLFSQAPEIRTAIERLGIRAGIAGKRGK